MKYKGLEVTEGNIYVIHWGKQNLTYIVEMTGDGSNASSVCLNNKIYYNKSGSFGQSILNSAHCISVRNASKREIDYFYECKRLNKYIPFEEFSNPNSYRHYNILEITEIK
jgi:hypothetical protein